MRLWNGKFNFVKLERKFSVLLSVRLNEFGTLALPIAIGMV